MKLRWLVKMTQPTADQVRDYSDQYDISLSEAKSSLSRHEGPVLQYWKSLSDTSNRWGSWATVPTVVETIETKWKPDESRTRQTTL
jgi:hypothetical protein